MTRPLQILRQQPRHQDVRAEDEHETASDDAAVGKIDHEPAGLGVPQMTGISSAACQHLGYSHHDVCPFNLDHVTHFILNLHFHKYDLRLTDSLPCLDIESSAMSGAQ